MLDLVSEMDFWKYFGLVNILIFWNSVDPSELTSLATPVYADTGQAVTLYCSTDSSAPAAWKGPCNNYFKNCTTNVVYFDGSMRHSNLPNTISLKTENDEETGIIRYDLLIYNVSKDNEGIYNCPRIRGGKAEERKYLVVLKENPFIINIKHSVGGKVNGTEGQYLKLDCEVIHGIQPNRISWYKDKRKMSDKFYPTRGDHNKSVVCEVMIDELDTPLRKVVTLNIKYRPVVYFLNVTTIEGTNCVMKCSADSNPPVTSMYLIKTKINTVVASCETSECRLQLNGSRYENGLYSCITSNKVGVGIANASVKILYPPAITVSLDNFTLRCDAEGEPMNVSYVSWKHYSEEGAYLKSFSGAEYLTLNSSYKMYMLNGLYLCEADNGISDTAGNVIQSGVPEILPITQLTQYGSYHGSVDVTIYVYSVANLTWKCTLSNGTIVDKTLFLKHCIKERIYGKGVILNGYIVSLRFSLLSEADFTNYTFMLINHNGSKNCTVGLRAKETPRTPTIQSTTVDNVDIVMSFKRNFSGGLPQNFVVEYKIGNDKDWTFVGKITDNFQETVSYRISKLQPNTEYCVRVYSCNTIGRSNFSDVCSIRVSGTVTAHNEDVYLYVWLPTGLILALIITVTFTKGKQIVIQLQRKIGLQDVFVDHINDTRIISRLTRTNASFDQVHELAVDSQAYQSDDSTPSVTERQGRPFSTSNESNQVRTSRAIPNLKYVELELSEASHSFQIHGDDRTIYTEINHSVVGPPAPESSESDDDGDNENKDDFMTLEQIKEMMINH